MRPGARYLGNERCEFRVWAPQRSKVDVKILSSTERIQTLTQDEEGYWTGIVSGVRPGADYLYILDNDLERPDPASAFQPHGPHAPSQIVGHKGFTWTDHNWPGIPLEKMIMYELHVGTFSRAGTFPAVIPYLDELQDIGINTLSLMPVAQFPGERNWGYDGVYPYAVQNSYGGPEDLKKLVDSCHSRGMAVMLDVVYNHLGPEGNYLSDFGPYFTERFLTPWGQAVNVDGPYSDQVRNYFIENALYWFDCYHMDGLRLDATDTICDLSARHFLWELAERTKAFSKARKKKFFLIPESDLNDPRLIRPPECGGYGLDAQWCDDFHHALHTLLTGENSGYYASFGKLEHLEKAFREGFVYSGQYSPYRKRRHGASSADCPAHRFVVCSQNHDQVGNRMLGDRLSTLVSFEALKLAAATVLLSPFVPLLFMGEEYGEENPFIYFVSHTDPELQDAVRMGRCKEFASFLWQGDCPDPQSPLSFHRSKLDREGKKADKHRILRNFYRRLIELRRTVPALSLLSKENLSVFSDAEHRLLLLQRWDGESHVLSFLNFSASPSPVKDGEIPSGRWVKILDSKAEEWFGPGSSLPEILQATERIIVPPMSVVLYRLEVLS